MPSVKLKTAVVLATMLVVSAAGAGSDNAGPEPSPTPSLVGALVSDPIAAVAAAVPRGASVVTSAADGNEFVYAAGDSHFSSVTTGGNSFSCGLARPSTAYCWGWNRLGQLGNETNLDSHVPVKVAGQP